MSTSSAPKRIVRPKASKSANAPSAMTVSGSATPAPSEELVATRAYQLWLAEGCPDGRALEHWVQAQHELAK
jgi:hypothetical protein